MLKQFSVKKKHMHIIKKNPALITDFGNFVFVGLAFYKNLLFRLQKENLF